MLPFLFYVRFEFASKNFQNKVVVIDVVVSWRIEKIFEFGTWNSKFWALLNPLNYITGSECKFEQLGGPQLWHFQDGRVNSQYLSEGLDYVVKWPSVVEIGKQPSWKNHIAHSCSSCFDMLLMQSKWPFQEAWSVSLQAFDQHLHSSPSVKLCVVRVWDLWDYGSIEDLTTY